MEKEYFVIRWVSCSNGGTDIIGITDDEEVAKAVCKMQPLFRTYEKVNFIKKDLTEKVKELAETYHDRVVFAGRSGSKEPCGCCKKDSLTLVCIEHDSQDYSKDLWVCSDCYSLIVTHWQQHAPKKICPI